MQIFRFEFLIKCH